MEGSSIGVLRLRGRRKPRLMGICVKSVDRMVARGMPSVTWGLRARIDFSCLLRLWPGRSRRRGCDRDHHEASEWPVPSAGTPTGARDLSRCQGAWAPVWHLMAAEARGEGGEGEGPGWCLKGYGGAVRSRSGSSGNHGRRIHCSLGRRSRPASTIASERGSSFRHLAIAVWSIINDLAVAQWLRGEPQRDGSCALHDVQRRHEPRRLVG